MERQGGAALAQFWRDRWRGHTRPMGISDLYWCLDPDVIRNRFHWHIGTTGPRLGRRCFGRFNRREIVRHARISHLTARRRLPSQSGTVFYPPLRSGGHLYRLDFPSAPGSGPSPCNTWVCLRSPCLSVGIANVVAGAVGETRLEAAPMDALVRDTIMGINESLAPCDEQLLQAAIERDAMVVFYQY